MAYFQKIQISEWHYRLTNENENVFCDLLLGSERAMVIDTAYGIGDLYAAVREITNLPIILVNTHGHGDHSQGNYQFPVPAHIGWADEDFCRESNTPAMKEKFLDLVRALPENFDLAAYAATGVGELIAIREGMVFELGGLTIRVYETPGHTLGSLCFYDETHHELYAGDVVNQVLLMHFPQSADLSTYEQSLNKIMELDFSVLFTGHALQETRAVLKDRAALLDVCRDPNAPVMRDPEGARIIVAPKYRELARLLEKDPQALRNTAVGEDFCVILVSDDHYDLLEKK